MESKKICCVHYIIILEKEWIVCLLLSFAEEGGHGNRGIWGCWLPVTGGGGLTNFRGPYKTRIGPHRRIGADVVRGWYGGAGEPMRVF